MLLSTFQLSGESSLNTFINLINAFLSESLGMLQARKKYHLNCGRYQRGVYCSRQEDTSGLSFFIFAFSGCACLVILEPTVLGNSDEF